MRYASGTVILSKRYTALQEKTRTLVLRQPCGCRSFCTQNLSIPAECESSSYQLIHKEKSHPKRGGIFLGGVGETRTLAPVTRPTPLAGAPRHQLEYYSVCRKIGCGEQPIRADLVVKKVWRRGRDSEPRRLLSQSSIVCYRKLTRFLPTHQPRRNKKNTRKGVLLVWRRGRDSNPWLFRVTGFQDRLLKPLGHLSVCLTHIIIPFLVASVNRETADFLKISHSCKIRVDRFCRNIHSSNSALCA